MTPRIRGSAYKKDNGKWAFFVHVSEMGKGDDGTEYDFPKFDFDTQKEAIVELQRVAKLMCDEYQTAVDGKPNGAYIDMKTNALRKWDKTDEQ